MPELTVRDLLRRKLQVPVTPAYNRAVSSVPAALVTVLKNDPSRVAFVFINRGSNDVFLAPQGGLDPRTGQGFVIAALGGALTVLWEEDGEVVAHEWAATATVGPNNVSIIELLIAKDAPPP